MKSDIFSTGTTLCGIRTERFCIIGTDQQASFGNKAFLNTRKAYKISDNLVVAGAGSSYACEGAANVLRGLYHHYENTLELKKDITPLLVLFQNHITKKGGMDGVLLIANKGFTNLTEHYRLYLLDGMASASQIYLGATGSGGDFSHGVLKDGYSQELTQEEGIALVKKSLRISKSLDIYSGGRSNIFLLNSKRTIELLEI